MILFNLNKYFYFIFLIYLKNKMHYKILLLFCNHYYYTATSFKKSIKFFLLLNYNFKNKYYFEQNKSNVFNN